MPEVFGRQHLTFIAIYVVLGVASLILAKLFLKERKGQTIFIKVLAGLTLFFNIGCRISVGYYFGRKYVFPSTICSLTSILLPLIVLFGKENLQVYHGLWYIALVGGLASTIYADYVSQNPSIFYLPTITGLLHHAFILLLVVAMVLFNWFKPDLKKWYYFPMIFTGYITIGTFALHVLGIENAMSITVSIISGTPLNCWFILGVGTALEVFVNLIYTLIVKYIQKKKATTN